MQKITLCCSHTLDLIIVAPLFECMSAGQRIPGPDQTTRFARMKSVLFIHI